MTIFSHFWLRWAPETLCLSILARNSVWQKHKLWVGTWSIIYLYLWADGLSGCVLCVCAYVFVRGCGCVCVHRIFIWFGLNKVAKWCYQSHSVAWKESFFSVIFWHYFANMQSVASGLTWSWQRCYHGFCRYHREKKTGLKWIMCGIFLGNMVHYCLVLKVLSPSIVF